MLILAQVVSDGLLNFLKLFLVSTCWVSNVNLLKCNSRIQHNKQQSVLFCLVFIIAKKISFIAQVIVEIK